MAETADYDCGDWKGHDFSSARKAYDVHAGRSYATAAAAGKTAASMVPESLKTNSPSPLVIACDVTGSMQDWPATIFSKLPYLDKEGQEYLGPDMEISFCAIGDAVKGDKYPVQVQPFSKGLEHIERLKNLVVEGGGGGGGEESYELTALYFARNVQIPQATKPILILIGDESPYQYVEKSTAAMAHVRLQEARIDTTAIFTELRRKFATYIIRKPYSVDDAGVNATWVKLLGKDHVVSLPSADRVVDVIFGILAQETDRVDYFRSEIEGRQRPEQIDTVYKSLLTVHGALPSASVDTSGKKVSSKSVMKLPPAGGSAKKSRHLLGK